MSRFDELAHSVRAAANQGNVYSRGIWIGMAISERWNGAITAIELQAIDNEGRFLHYRNQVRELERR